MSDDTLFTEDVDTLLGAPQPTRSPVVTEAKIDTIARFLAGFRYPTGKKYEQLPAAKRQACRDAAEMALTHLQNQPD